MYVCMVCMYACYVCMYMYLCYVCVYVIYVCMCSLTPSLFWPPAQPWPSLSFHCLTTSWGFIDLYCVHPSAPDSHTRHPRNQISLKLPVCCSSTLSPAPIPTVSSTPTLPRSHTPPWHLSAPRAHVYPPTPAATHQLRWSCDHGHPGAEVVMMITKSPAHGHHDEMSKTCDNWASGTKKKKKRKGSPGLACGSASSLGRKSRVQLSWITAGESWGFWITQCLGHLYPCNPQPMLYKQL